MKVSRKWKFGMMALASASLLAACASEPDNDGAATNTTGNTSNNEGEAEASEEVADGNDLIIAVLSDASRLDPHTSNDVPSGNIQVNIYETLLRFNDDMELESNLATEWVDVDERTWEFTLQEGITFTDGEAFNADAVKANIDRILDDEVGAARKILFEIIDEVEVIDDTTVRFHTSEPFAPLPAHFAHYASSMISPAVIEADYDNFQNGDGNPGDYINENPIGTGFFTYDEWNPGDSLRLVKNEDYWGDLPHVDSVTFRVVPEDLTRVSELETGSAHIIDPVTPSDMARVNDGDTMEVYQRNAASITYLGFNTEREPYDDDRVRRAISMALSKDAMMEGVLEGTGELAYGPINDTQFGFSTDVTQLERDPEAARELLAEAGYADGFETTIWTNDSRERMDIAELAQADLAEIGIQAEIEVVEWGAYLEQTGQGEHDMFILGLSLGTMDADYPMHMLFHSENSGASGNRSFYQDAEFDALLQEARVEQDEDVRFGLYEDAVDYLIEESPAAFLYHPDHIMGYRSDVSGFWADASGLYQLQDVTID
ncbi:glutathione ABC transporter substrate-binding protein [Paenalkalicoccus suaedae]|uniref:Glutathione ABC transporter substrate-binding protein n=1 Tax=Paenalkalicoccus suaedae TaxID=2592382 RepID=A0A859FG08_9BACI|nr:glutathione ABC transporter substrate-binding protein [Paenalkalicoccus suaedae]QKS71612.1 glutathione ABC transporter substrate-binding protein [Paenalkalicoccus suaedae]